MDINFAAICGVLALLASANCVQLESLVAARPALSKINGAAAHAGEENSRPALLS
jgi:hypothetical protein